MKVSWVMHLNMDSHDVPLDKYEIETCALNEMNICLHALYQIKNGNLHNRNKRNVNITQTANSDTY